MPANDKQIGGKHYKVEPGKEEHWDRVWRLGLNYFQGQATKYVERYKDKGGKDDLLKAIHFIEKLIELEYPEPVMPTVTWEGHGLPRQEHPNVQVEGYIGADLTEYKCVKCKYRVRAANLGAFVEIHNATVGGHCTL